MTMTVIMKGVDMMMTSMTMAFMMTVMVMVSALLVIINSMVIYPSNSPLPEEQVGSWLRLLIFQYGMDLMRYKGILSVISFCGKFFPINTIFVSGDPFQACPSSSL
jgi:hypothetical protein